MKELALIFAIAVLGNLSAMAIDVAIYLDDRRELQKVEEFDRDFNRKYPLPAFFGFAQ
jgi:hypothetical protein